MIELITGPTTLGVTLPVVKEHLKIPFDVKDYDKRLENQVIPAAINQIETLYGVNFKGQTWDYWIDEAPSVNIRLPYAPVTSVTHVKYYDLDSTEAAWSNTLYTLDPKNGRIFPNNGETFPTSLRSWNALVTRFVTTGYTDVPNDLIQAVCIAVAFIWSTPGDSLIGHGVNILDEVTIARIKAVSSRHDRNITIFL